MRNSTLKFLIMACIILMAGYSNAQFKFGDKSSIGQTFVLDSETGVAEFVTNFNTDKSNSTWTKVNDSTTTISWSKCQTYKGIQTFVRDTAGNKTYNGDFKLKSYRSYDNPVRIASIDSLKGLMAKWAEVHAGMDDSAKNTINGASACLFDLDESGTNQALGVHPGMWKSVEYGFYYKFSGYKLSSDLSFTIDTYDEGNTGQTANYLLHVKADGGLDTTIVDFYVTGSGKKEVNLAAAAGVDISAFDGKSVYFELITEGTGTEAAEGTHDPTIVFDDFSVSLLVPSWVEPAADNNSENPFLGIVGEETMFAMPLKTKGRFSSLKITDNLYKNGSGNKVNKMLTFLDTLGVMANDGSGNYTVEVPYTINPAVLDAGTLEWSNQSIVIDAPEDVVNDDLMFFFKATPEASVYYCNVEIDCGARIFYKAHIKGLDAPAEWNISDSIFNALGELGADTTVNGLAIYAAPDKTVKIDANNKSIDGMDFTHRLKLGGSGRFVEGMPDARVIGFDVKGNTTITIAAMSSSSSSDRVLYIAAGTKENVIDSFPAMGASIGKEDFNYIGEPTTIYLYSPSSGVNLYYLKTAPMFPTKVAYVTADVTMDPSAAAPDNDPVIKMLMADPLFDVDVKVVGNDGTPDLSAYDVVVAQEGFSSSASIFKPGGSLGLENIAVPFIYNKAYALRDGKAVSSASSATKEVAGQLYIDVPVASQSSDLFSGITFDGDSVMLFKSGATDAGIAGEKAFSYTVDLEMTDATTLLAQPKGATENVSVSFNDIPAGTVLGTQDTLQARMIAISENFGAMCKDGGSNMTNEGLTIWRNALYMAAGLAVPTTLYEDVATLDTLYASVGELSPMFDAGKTAYQLNLPSGTTSVGLIAVPTSELASVTTPGAISLSDGDNKEVSVVVMSPLNTDTMTYTVSIHVQSEKEILYVSNSNGVYGTAEVNVTGTFDALTDAGYSVTIVDKLALNSEGFDYSPYAGLVIGSGVGSSWVNNFAKDGYPIPCVTMQHDGPRKGKWGWVGTDKDNNVEMNVVKTAEDTPADSAKMEITNIDHYITEGYELGQLVEWNNGTGLSEDWAGQEVKSYNFADSIATAIPLGRISIDGSALTSWWAVPAGASVRSLTTDGYARVTLANNVVYLGVFNAGLLYSTDGFDDMLVRSLQWALGEDKNAKLASLTPSTGDLAPEFNSEKTGYQLNLPMGSTAVSLSAIAENPNATVTVSDALTLSDGMTETMTVKVVSAGKKDSMIYKVMVHVQAEEEILFVSNSSGAYWSAGADVTNVFDGLVGADYSVTLLDKLALNDAGFDYAPYAGLVIGGGVGSSWVNNFAIDGYPIPCVTMQHDGPRKGKWGWVGTDKDDNKQMNVVRTSDTTPADSAKMQITDNNHYITEGFEMGELVEWQNGDGLSEDWANSEVKSYNLADSIPSAIALGRIAIDGTALTNWWAIPRGSQVTTRGADGTYARVALENRIVVLTIFNQGLLYATEAFDTMMVRSLEWVLGAGGTVGVTRTEVENNVLVYPNPAKTFAKVRFTLTESADVSLSLYNMMGQKIEISNKERFSVGTNEIEVNTQNFKEGLYIYVLEAGSKVAKGKLNITK